MTNLTKAQKMGLLYACTAVVYLAAPGPWVAGFYGLMAWVELNG